MNKDDIIQNILSVLDELKQNISAVEIAANSSEDTEVKKLADKALNILNISKNKIENIYQKTRNEKEILEILEYVKKKSADIVSLTLNKINEVKNPDIKKIETEKIEPGKPDFSQFVTPIFDRNGFDKAIKDAMVEDEKFNQRAREIMADIMAENISDEKPAEVVTEADEINAQATNSLRSWLNSNDKQ